jgi:hypothetical protein
LKGTTAEDDPLPAGGCTMTCVALIVFPLTVPTTRTGSPLLTALAVVDVVPFTYFVEDVSLTVSFWPADVDNVKLDVDTLPTVPTAPPAAGPDRAPIFGGFAVVAAAAELLPEAVPARP